MYGWQLRRLSDAVATSAITLNADICLRGNIRRKGPGTDITSESDRILAASGPFSIQAVQTPRDWLSSSLPCIVVRRPRTRTFFVGRFPPS
jgi:hypothetical protein